MSTSLFEGLIRSEAAQWDAYAPVDTAWSRSVIQNVMHSADECAQPLINFRVAVGNASQRVLTQASTWYAVWASPALPCRVRGDGTTYPLRLRLRAARGTAGTVDFGITVVGGRLTVDAAYDAIAVGAPVAATASTSSATAAWLTLSTPSINMATGTGSVTEIERSTFAEIGGAAVAVRYDAIKVIVMAKREAGSSSSTSALFSGLHACEYIGV